MKKTNRKKLKLDTFKIRVLTPDLDVAGGAYGLTANITCTCYTLTTTTNAGCK